MGQMTAYVQNVEFDVDVEVKAHAALVKRIAYHLIGRLPASVQVDDLIQVGMMALMQAVKNYNPLAGASLTTYASIRVRGAMIDEVRRNDWVPRTVRNKFKQLQKAITKLEHNLGREATDYEIAKELGINVDEYHLMLSEVQGQHFIDIDEVDPLQNGVPNELVSVKDDPVEMLQQEELQESLARMIDRLPEREKLVLSLYYNENLNLQEIGKMLGVSESRVCQIHGQALIRLKSRLEMPGIFD